MTLKAKTASLAAGIALMAAPALAYAAGQQPSTTPPGYNGTTNPGTTHVPATTPPDNNGADNPGTSHVPSNAQARALGAKECQQFKTNFKTNKSAFGKCISAVAKSLRSDSTPAEACKAKRLSRVRHDGQSRSDFKACVLAATKANKAASES
jgi:hypothetical protein